LNNFGHDKKLAIFLKSGDTELNQVPLERLN
jgi:hypothetical protein